MNKLNFTISELIHSESALKWNINNMPDINSLDCMLDLIFYCLQPIRDYLKTPMIITSGFRCKDVNTLVGGKLTSQHLKGQAADFVVSGKSVREIIDLINKSGIEYDQLINEYDRWCHISFVKGKNRRRCFKIG